MSNIAGKAKSKKSKSASTEEGYKPGYKPGPEFEEDSKEPLVDISSSDSTELWLIQWPLNQLQPADFNGKELTLKLHREGKLGGFVSESGKSYDFVSFAAHEPNATVFQPSESETKIVGKISRRVSLVRYPEPGEMEKPRFILSSQKSEGSALRSMYRSSATAFRHGSLFGKDGTSHDTLASAYDPEVRTEISRKSKRKHDRQMDSPEIPARPTELSSASGFGSNAASNLVSEQSHGENSKKKRKLKVEH